MREELACSERVHKHIFMYRSNCLLVSRAIDLLFVEVCSNGGYYETQICTQRDCFGDAARDGWNWGIDKEWDCAGG